MKLSRFYCSWCEYAKLEFVETSYDAPNGSTCSSISGIYLGCSLRSITSCPDATGVCKTEQQAEDIVIEQNQCKPYRTFDQLTGGLYADRVRIWKRYI